MRAAVLGAGMMGSAIAWDLSRSSGVDEVVVADVDRARLSRLKKKVGSTKLSAETIDVRRVAKAAEFIRDFDVVVSALPHGAVNSADRAAAWAGAKMVDIAFEDAQMGLDDAMKASGGLLIPGCGLAPGLAGVLLAHGVRTQKGADEGHILVGGIPQRPLSPFGYRLVFSIVGLIREYTDDARVFRSGKMLKVRPFSTVERVKFPKPVGVLEAFCTDGLASLVYTMNGMRVMDEKTLRWPGHAEKMNLLLESGFFSTESVRVEAGLVRPIEVSWRVLEKKLGEGGPKDMTVMRVEAKAPRSEVVYDLVDRYDSRNGISSMGRTTGFTASLVAQMVGSGEIRGSGVVPPESALRGHDVERLLSGLARRGVRVSESRRSRRR